ncbi:MAG: type III pantothenate kinase, partial [Paracoccaceae bacterium]
MQPMLEQAMARGVRRFVLLSSSLFEPGGPLMGGVHAWLSAHADEWAVLLRGLLADAGPTEPVSGVSVCSTVPAVLHEWREMLASHFADVPSLVVEPGVRTGVPVLMDNPREVGADRIINALAAATLHGGPAIVVDFGTATTFDVISEQGQYVGGAIAPGIEISLEALGRRGAQLRKVELMR